MSTLGFDSYIEPLRVFLAKVRDASKYDRTITMGGDLPENIRTQVDQTSASLNQSQTATTTTNANPTTTTTAANPNGLEPYGHSVRFFKENPNFSFACFSLSGSCCHLYSK